MAAIPVDEIPAWITGEPIRTEEVLRVYKFFVMNSPVDGLSSRQKSLLDYGWNTPWRKPYSMRKRLNHLVGNKDFLFTAQKYDTLDVTLTAADLMTFPPTDHKERAAIHNGKSTQYLSLFFHIRNGFAHGRYNTIQDGDDIIFIMEDVTSRRKGMANGQKTLSARIVIRLSTLSRWMDLIEGGETV